MISYRLLPRRISSFILPLKFRFSDTSSGFKKVVNFEKIRMSLSEMNDPIEILTIFEDHKKYFQKGDFIIALRAICRTLKSAKHMESSNDNEIVKHPKLQELVNLIAGTIHQLSPKG
jgi:hypothetical protein